MKGKEELENLARKIVRGKDLDTFYEAKDTLGAIDWMRLRTIIRKEQEIYVSELLEELKELKEEEERLQAILTDRVLMEGTLYEELQSHQRRLMEGNGRITKRERTVSLTPIGEA